MEPTHTFLSAERLAPLNIELDNVHWSFAEKTFVKQKRDVGVGNICLKFTLYFASALGGGLLIKTPLKVNWVK